MFTSVSSKLMMTAMAASSLLKLLRPGTTMLSRSSWEGSPALSEVELLVPAAVLESDWDWDCDELPAASSLLDALLLVCGDTSGHFSWAGPNGLEAPLDGDEFTL